jgi:hypothetical protein
LEGDVWMMKDSEGDPVDYILKPKNF